MSRDWFGLFLNDGRASSQADMPLPPSERGEGQQTGHEPPERRADPEQRDPGRDDGGRPAGYAEGASLAAFAAFTT